MLLVLLALSVMGCADTVGTSSSGGITYSRICIDGVEYLSSRYRLTAHFKPDGSLYICNTTRK